MMFREHIRQSVIDFPDCLQPLYLLEDHDIRGNQDPWIDYFGIKNAIKSQSKHKLLFKMKMDFRLRRIHWNFP